MEIFILMFYVTPFYVVRSDFESGWYRCRKTKAYS